MKAFVIPLVAAVLLALGVSPSAADGTKIIISGGHFISGGQFHRHEFIATHPHTNILVVPQTVYVVPSYPRWVPGYWTYQWIPQVQTSYVWVPAHYDANGYWVEDHYAPQTVQTGYYQPIWISGYWNP